MPREDKPARVTDAWGWSLLLLLCLGNHRRKRNSQGAGQRVCRVNSRISQAPFKQTNVRLVQASPLRQRLFAQTARGSPAFQDGGEGI